MEINEIKAQTILNPTSIDLGEYVINPYKGCAYGCLYCYARGSKVAEKDERGWGEYLDVKIDPQKMIEKELLQKKPVRVLLGSTTECFQPVDAQYNTIGKILSTLNDHGVEVSIMTRSPLILEHLDILKKTKIHVVYFTVNAYSKGIKEIIESKSPSLDSRYNAMEILRISGINIIPYFSPVLPLISHFEEFFLKTNKFQYVELEGINFKMGNIDEIIRQIQMADSNIGRHYTKMLNDEHYYDEIWEESRKKIQDLSRKFNKKTAIHIHSLREYFTNTYTSPKI